MARESTQHSTSSHLVLLLPAEGEPGGRRAQMQRQQPAATGRCYLTLQLAAPRRVAEQGTRHVQADTCAAEQMVPEEEEQSRSCAQQCVFVFAALCVEQESEQSQQQCACVSQFPT